MDSICKVLGMTVVNAHPNESTLHNQLTMLMEGFRANQSQIDLEIENLKFSELQT